MKVGGGGACSAKTSKKNIRCQTFVRKKEAAENSASHGEARLYLGGKARDIRAERRKVTGDRKNKAYKGDRPKRKIAPGLNVVAKNVLAFSVWGLKMYEKTGGGGGKGKGIPAKGGIRRGPRNMLVQKKKNKKGYLIKGAGATTHTGKGGSCQAGDDVRGYWKCGQAPCSLC